MPTRRPRGVPEATEALVCVECGATTFAHERGWIAEVVWADEGPDDELVFFCPECAEREFGE